MSEQTICTIQAREVSDGDVLEWCGRWCPVDRVEIVKPGHGGRRPGRHLYVTTPDVGTQRLHYYYDEWVRVKRRVAAAFPDHEPLPIARYSETLCAVCFEPLKRDRFEWKHRAASDGTLPTVPDSTVISPETTEGGRR